jgi:hypothetical protein
MRGAHPSDDAEGILSDRQTGLTIREIAERYGWSMAAVNKIIGNAGLTDRQERDPSPEEMAKWCKRHLADLQREHGARQ